MIEERFTCNRDGLTIRGIICRNEEIIEKQPAIIMSHGFTGNMYGGMGYCKSLCEEGYVCVLFSFCGGGSKFDSEEVKSDGNSWDMTVSSEVADLTTVVEYVSRLPFVDRKKIVLLGESQGGFVSALTAAKLKEKIQKLVLIFPALCIPDHARMGKLGFANYDPSNMPEKIDVGSTIIGKKLHDDVVNIDPFLEIAKYEGKVLIIHGDEDKVVDVSYSSKAQKAYRDGQCSLQVMRNMGHGINESQREPIIASLRQFLRDKNEILTFRIILTTTENSTQNGKNIADVHFTGYCESKLFTGCILPGAVDHQIYDGDKLESMEARYTFEGLDSEGKKTCLSVVNKWGGNDWTPSISTDSEALKWLNDAELTAVLEHSASGPTVRIFYSK